MARANIKVSEAFHERHNERRQDLGLTWEEYIDGQAPNAPEVSVGAVELEPTEYRKIADELETRLR